MAFRYEQVVPWGRSFEEYVRMFGLTDDELNLRILGCGDGPASFNSEMARRGKTAVSIDPIYQFSAEELGQRIDETYPVVIGETYENREKYVWKTIRSVEELGRIRMAAMEAFLADYEQGKREGRYINAELPTLPFRDMEFDIALCAHFLFLYTDILSLGFHIDAINEMCRVSKEVRIFPLLDMNSDRSIYVDPVKIEFRCQGKTVVEDRVNYEFQRNGNTVLKIRNGPPASSL